MTQDWVNSREVLDEDQVSPGQGDGSGPGGSDSKKQKLQYLPVPDDPMLANAVCPICQEKFETRWLDDAQEFVWPDAIRVGDRIYHASCHREATGGSGAVAALYGNNNNNHSRNTPEPVLGKRKAEVCTHSSRTSKSRAERTNKYKQDEMSGLRNKLKTES
jgi:pre-mRNA cleavage complex 2 protein Pcf11